MKAVWIFYDIVLDAKILALLKEVSPGDYTRWPRLTGDGPQSGPRLDDHVWPGINAALLAVRDAPPRHRLPDPPSSYRTKSTP